jgi:hypothetical protein
MPLRSYSALCTLVGLLVVGCSATVDEVPAGDPSTSALLWELPGCTPHLGGCSNGQVCRAVANRFSCMTGHYDRHECQARGEDGAACGGGDWNECADGYKCVDEGVPCPSPVPATWMIRKSVCKKKG